MTSEPASSLLARQFDPCRAAMAAAVIPARSGAMYAAATSIRNHAANPWQLILTTDGPMFTISTAHFEVRLNESMFSRLFQDVISQIHGTDDNFLVEVVEIVSKSDIDIAITNCFLLLFFSHELLHVYQQLGSNQYRDSDYYLEAVEVVDYQADVAAFWFISHYVDAPLGLSPRQYVAFLISMHIFTMNAFNKFEGDRWPIFAFNRLLVWHFQLARIIRSDYQPDLSHASIQTMPVLTFPRHGSLMLQQFAGMAPASELNGATRVGHDIVAALCDGRGIQRILRMTSTDPERIPKLVNNVLERNLSGVREELEEFFQSFDRSLDFAHADSTIYALEATRASAERLVYLQNTRNITLSDADVRLFFGQAERLVFQRRPTLKGEGLDDFRKEWKDGVRAALDKTLAERVGLNWRTDGSASDISDTLKWEISRVANRLSSSLDELLD